MNNRSLRDSSQTDASLTINLIVILFKVLSTFSTTILTRHNHFGYLPPSPANWTSSEPWLGTPKIIISVMSSMSTPRPNALVAIIALCLPLETLVVLRSTSKCHHSMVLSHNSWSTALQLRTRWTETLYKVFLTYRKLKFWV